MSLAFFDMDGTLVNGDTNTLFIKHLYKEKIIDDSFLKPLSFFHEEYFKGTLHIEDFIFHVINPLCNISKEKRDSIVIPCIENDIMPHIKEGAKKAIQYHKDKGDTLFLVTTTVDYIASEVASRLNIDHVIATPLFYDDKGVLQKKINGIPPYKEGKKIRILNFIKDHNLSLDDSYAYGDSINDIDMFSICSHKIGIDINEELKNHPYAKNLELRSFL